MTKRILADVAVDRMYFIEPSLQKDGFTILEKSDRLLDLGDIREWYEKGEFDVLFLQPGAATDGNRGFTKALRREIPSLPVVLCTVSTHNWKDDSVELKMALCGYTGSAERSYQSTIDAAIKLIA